MKSLLEKQESQPNDQIVMPALLLSYAARASPIEVGSDPHEPGFTLWNSLIKKRGALTTEKLTYTRY